MLIIKVLHIFSQFSPSHFMDFATGISSMHMAKVVVVVDIVADDVVVDI